MTGSARAAALEAIRRVLEEDAYSTLAVDVVLSRSGLDERDRAFATELAYGTLRRKLVLEPQIEGHSSRPLARITPAAYRLLLLGAYQLRETAVAPYAAVDETVALAGPRERGFVNAVLRRLAEGAPVPVEGDDVDAVQARTGLAAWAVRELRHLVGDEAEEAAAALARPAPLTLRVNRCRAEVEGVLAELAPLGGERGRHDPDAVTLPGGRPARLPGWERGAFAVMDEASTLVARAVDARPGARVLDACAGPGGKTGALACDVLPDGIVVAGDVHPARARLVRRTLDRLGLAAHVVVQDASKPSLRDGFDRALVDAPCSGLGSARRRPELLWRPRKDALSTLARRQVAIAVACADLLRPGGRLLYAVCTFPRAETDAACDAIVRHRPGLRPVETPGPDGPALRHRLWPHRHGTDGMFYAAFERTS